MTVGINFNIKDDFVTFDYFKPLKPLESKHFLTKEEYSKLKFAESKCRFIGSYIQTEGDCFKKVIESSQIKAIKTTNIEMTDYSSKQKAKTFYLGDFTKIDKYF